FLQQQNEIQKKREENELMQAIAKNKEKERQAMFELQRLQTERKGQLEIEELEKLNKEREEQRNREKQSKTYNGSERGYDTNVSYQVEIYGSGKIDVNFRLIYYNSSTTKFRLELL